MSLSTPSALAVRGRPGSPIAYLQCAWFIGLMMLSLSALGATIQVTPDRSPVNQGESFTLTFSAAESPDDDPDFSPLRDDFDILSQSSGSQFSIDNGKFSRSTEWSLVLMPKRAGNLTIPAIAFGKDHSQPLSILVSAVAASSAGGDSDTGLMLEFDAEPQNPYVQAQVILSLRVLRRISIADANLADPVVPDALVQRLAEDRQYSVERDGKTYAVIERRFALFPQKSGPLHIAPLTLEAQIGGGRSRFNSFFQSSRITRVQSKSIDLNVRPVPAEFAGKHWLPAESLVLEQTWSKTPPATTTGEPLTRTLTLRALGATVGVLPEMESASVPPEIKAYPDQPTLREEKQADGVSSIRQEKVALIPSKSGNLVLAPIEIPWWNTKTDRMEIARLPEQAVAVQAASGAEPVEPPATVDIAQPAPPKPAATQLSVEGSLAAYRDPWFWSSALFALAWLGTALMWWRASASRLKKTAQPVQRPENDQGALHKSLLEACRANDPERARAALLSWIKTLWPDTPLSAIELERRLGSAFAQEMASLERVLYGQGESTWRGEELARLVSQWKRCAQPVPKPTTNLLEPLYKN